MRSIYEERKLMNQADEEAQRILSVALSKESPIRVLVPWKSHRSLATGAEFGSKNQAILEGAKTAMGLENVAWASKKTIEGHGGAIRAGHETQGVRIITRSQQSRMVPVLDEKGNKIINPETGEPDQKKEYYGPGRCYAIMVWNADQVEGATWPERPMAPTPGRRLPAAISSVWSEIKMEPPRRVEGLAMSYDITDDTLTLPARDVVKDHRQATLGAYEVARHLAYSVGSPKRLNIPSFHNPELFDQFQPQVDLVCATAAALFMKNHCEKWDPQVIEQGGVSEVANLSRAIEDRSINLPVVMKQAVDIYSYMAFGPKRRAMAS